ncbi:MAG: hypothetical protein VXZ15_13290, partial [Planctomycetota bacterium]|nr:hypothetical protein [Planctomycetota bacterium]
RECDRGFYRFARNGSYEYRNRRSSHKPDPQENRLGLNGLKVVELGDGKMGVSAQERPEVCHWSVVARSVNFQWSCFVWNGKFFRFASY